MKEIDLDKIAQKQAEKALEIYLKYNEDMPQEGREDFIDLYKDGFSCGYLEARNHFNSIVDSFCSWAIREDDGNPSPLTCYHWIKAKLKWENWSK